MYMYFYWRQQNRRLRVNALQLFDADGGQTPERAGADGRSFSKLGIKFWDPEWDEWSL
jgi:hypothetical protein